MKKKNFSNYFLRKNLILIFVLVLIIASSPPLSLFVSATWGDSATEKFSSDLEWKGMFIGIFYNLLLPSLIKFYDNLENAILANPSIDDPSIYEPLTFFIKILEPIYVLLIILCGFYLILMSTSPKGRTRVKILFPNLMIGMLLVTFSMYIIKLTLSASQNLSQDILNLDPAKSLGRENIFSETFNLLVGEFPNKAAVSFEGGHFLLVISFITVFGIFTMIILRYILITFFAILLPIAIFFYFFSLTKNIGRKMLEQTFIWAFSQAITALIFVVSNLGVILLNVEGILKLIVGLIASFLLIISPLILFMLLRRFLP